MFQRLGLTLSLVLVFTLGASARRLVEGPQVMPHVTPAMLEAAYWVARNPSPDRVICPPEELRRLEGIWRSQGLLLDLASIPEVLDPEKLRLWLTEDFRFISKGYRYGANGRRLTSRELRALKGNVHVAGVGRRPEVRWGMTTRRSRMKLFPTSRIVTFQPLDLEFNILNHTEIPMAEPVAVLHASADKQWLYVAAEVGRGWIAAEDVAFTTRDGIREYQEQPYRIVIAAEARFRDGSGRLLLETAKMGTRLAIADREAGLLALPRKDRDARLYFQEVVPELADTFADQPRPFTARSVIEQAFRLLNVPYGWGGEYGYGDCSEFIRSVALACGVSLPRNTSSLNQALPARSLKAALDEKQAILSQLPGGVSLLMLPGHVMLYLGSEEGRIYVIHNLYGIHDQDQKGAYIHRVARVVVSELSLGEGSRRGSLFQRVNRALFLSPELQTDESRTAELHTHPAGEGSERGETSN